MIKSARISFLGSVYLQEDEDKNEIKVKKNRRKNVVFHGGNCFYGRNIYNYETWHLDTVTALSIMRNKPEFHQLLCSYDHGANYMN